MDQPGAVGDGEPAEHGRQHGGDGVWRHRPPFPQQLAQGSALDEFHHEKRVPSVEALVVDGDESGILQPGDGAGLALEPGEELLVAGVPGIHDLERYGAIQPDVEPPVHRGHASGRDHPLHAVTAIQHDADEGVRLLAGFHACILDLAR